MDYFLNVLIIITIFIPLALSLDLLVGRTGILSVAHASMYGLGAYTTAILTKSYGLSFLLSVLTGIFIVGIFAFCLSKVLSKLKGDYYTLGSFGVSIIVFSLLMNLECLTGGPLGIFSIPQINILGIVVKTNLEFLLVSSLFATLIILFIYFLNKSRFGLVIQAIRDDESAVRVFGYETEKYKTMVFVIAAIIASTAGALYASYFSFINPDSFTLNESIFMLTMVIVGGLASMRGAIFGAIFIIVLPEILRFAGLPETVATQLQIAIYGMILMFLMYQKPSGIFGNYTP